MLLAPLARMTLTIAQMQFICELKTIPANIYLTNHKLLVLNTTELDMAKHKVIARFGLMHMVATNLCEWLYTLVEETKHEIWHLAHGAHSEHEALNGHHADIISNGQLHNSTSVEVLLNSTSVEHNLVRRAALGSSQKYNDCQRTNIMGSLVQNSSPFLFPCTIEYSLICAVILFEMWKKVRSIPEINKGRKNSIKHVTAHHAAKDGYQFSIDCSKAHRGMFAGIVVIVMTIICLIMYFVLHEKPHYVQMAIKEVTYYEIFMYTVCGTAVLVAFFRMRDLKFQRKSGGELLQKSLQLAVFGLFQIHISNAIFTNKLTKSCRFL